MYYTFMDEFDVGDGGVVLVGDLLFELFYCFDGVEINIEGEGLLFGWCFEV